MLLTTQTNNYSYNRYFLHYIFLRNSLHSLLSLLFDTVSECKYSAQLAHRAQPHSRFAMLGKFHCLSNRLHRCPFYI